MICWTHTPNVVCATKSSYKTFLQESQVSSTYQRSLITDQEVTLLNQVWKDKTMSPRVEILLGVLLEGQL